MNSITLKRGVAKPIKFTVSTNGNVVDCSTATIKYYVASKDGSTYLIQKEDVDFNKTYAAMGILIIDLSALETDIDPHVYRSEIMLTFAADNIDKSADIDFVIEDAVI